MFFYISELLPKYNTRSIKKYIEELKAETKQKIYDNRTTIYKREIEEELKQFDSIATFFNDIKKLNKKDSEYDIKVFIDNKGYHKFTLYFPLDMKDVERTLDVYRAKVKEIGKWGAYCVRKDEVFYEENIDTIKKLFKGYTFYGKSITPTNGRFSIDITSASSLNESMLYETEWNLEEFKCEVASYITGSQPFDKFLSNLVARYEDEWQYEDIEEYYELIQKHLSHRFAGVIEIVPISDYGKKSEECYLTFAVRFADGEGFCCYYDDDLEDYDCSWEKPINVNVEEPIKITASKYIDKSQFGKKVIQLNGEDYTVGDFYIGYSDFEGGYVTIGQIIAWENEPNKYLYISQSVTKKRENPIKVWNTAVETKDYFVSVGYINLKCWDGRVIKAVDELYPYSKEKLAELMDKLK